MIFAKTPQIFRKVLADILFLFTGQVDLVQDAGQFRQHDAVVGDRYACCLSFGDATQDMAAVEHARAAVDHQVVLLQVVESREIAAADVGDLDVRSEFFTQ